MSVTCHKTWAASPGEALADGSAHLKAELGYGLGLACSTAVLLLNGVVEGSAAPGHASFI